MASPATAPVVPSEQEVTQSQMEQEKVESVDAAVEETPAQTEQPTEGQEVVLQESKLHRFCAEGDVMGVRGILSLSLELLESIDPNTGLTPMLQAIYASQVPVVRELMAAGAYPPPPSVTQNPDILALLYPSHAYPMNFQPPAQHQLQHQMNPIQYQYQAQGGHHQMPMHQVHMQQGQHQQGQEFFQQYSGGQEFMGQQREMRQSGNEAGQNGHDRAAQKNVLCRNLPNCRFGASCYFFHPSHPGQFQQQPFFPPHAPQVQEFHPQSSIPHPQAPSFVPLTAQPLNADPTFFPSGPSDPSNAHINGHNAHINVNAPQVPSASTPAFVPTFVPSHAPFPGQSAQASTQPQQVAQLPSQEPQTQNAPVDAKSPPANGTIYTSPPPPTANGPIPAPMINGSGLPTHGRPIQFVPPFPHQPQPFLPNGHQMQPGVPQPVAFDRKPVHHVKKPSMAGGRFVGPRGQVALGPWPPACVFFSVNKCRNGDMCKFPHLLPDGTDCRHPDVIAGILPAAPVSAAPSAFPRGPKARPGMMNGAMPNGFHPNVAQQQHQFQAIQRMHAAQLANRAAAANGVVSPVETPAAAPVEEAPNVAAAQTETAPSAPRAVSQSRSVPNTRAHSPTHSTASYNGPRAMRPTGRAAQGLGAPSARSASIPAAPKQAQVVKQRVPSADDFPSLGEPGQVKAAPVVNGKTAAQVLAAPAPEKVEKEVVGESAAVESANHDVTTESDDDAVLVSNKTHPKSSATTPAAAPTSSTSSPQPRAEIPRAGMSFASIASSAAAAIESSSMVSLQA